MKRKYHNSDNSFTPKFTYIHNTKIAVKLEGNCLKQNKVCSTHENVVNSFIVYELDISCDLNTDFTLITILNYIIWSC